jgi:HSP20 family protein
MTALTEEVRRTLGTLREKVDSALDRLRPEHEDEQTRQMARRPIFRGPDLDVEEMDDAVELRAELPGLRPEDVEVQVTNSSVILRGQKKEEREQERGTFHVVERRYGAFLRSIPLPCEVDSEAAEARFHDGVLQLRLPKTEASKSRHIRVDVGGE